ncbi:GPI mannosyltransferase 3 [[Candida] railenensis]|uniref:Mannosyltransferase n=1 Tax=[Candida] railenensis TaxID=45579 RepID=A0A9P0QS85_9ASCO|nr:GPI mannosyltransferase 3 [[Candida] railenensis]
MSGVKQRNNKKDGNYVPSEEKLVDSKDSSASAFTSTSCILLFWKILGIRLANALLTTTYFQADEFYQCLEPAHKLAFGYGYITWEWNEKLRSSIHPWIYAIGYKLTSCLNIDIVVAPKVIGAILASIGECFLYKFALNYSEGNVKLAKVALIMSLINPFNWYIITRSFSNNFEMILTTIGLSCWPFNNNDNKSIVIKKALISSAFGIISCIVRPTNAILWLCLGAHLLFRLKDIRAKLALFILIETILILSVNTVIDYLFYNEVTFPIYNFIQFNVIKSLSIFYGVAPWHFYIFQAIPIMTMTSLPFLIHYLISLKGYKSVLGISSFIVVGSFSLINHKEFRFIYPLQPVFILFVAMSIVENYARVRRFAIPMIAINIAIAYFFTRVNERGVIDVIYYLRGTNESFGLLTPCHSTPWQSYLHNPNYNDGNSWALTCEPPLHLSKNSENNIMEEIKKYRDESDMFYDDPTSFINENFPPVSYPTDVYQKGKKYAWPARLIIFSPEEDLITSQLGTKYIECNRFFNSYFHWDSRRSGDVIVYCSK